MGLSKVNPKKNIFSIQFSVYLNNIQYILYIFSTLISLIFASCIFLLPLIFAPQIFAHP